MFFIQRKTVVNKASNIEQYVLTWKYQDVSLSLFHNIFIPYVTEFLLLRIKKAAPKPSYPP